mmetsp:Transcript_17313/g.45179  ORF Transcript_17313/g.45179 Transcript_17313/m.45179 type:complete len:265 (+) Transcript_17313:63-857(+)
MGWGSRDDKSGTGEGECVRGGSVENWWWVVTTAIIVKSRETANAIILVASRKVLLEVQHLLDHPVAPPFLVKVPLLEGVVKGYSDDRLVPLVAVRSKERMVDGLLGAETHIGVVYQEPFEQVHGIRVRRGVGPRAPRRKIRKVALLIAVIQLGLHPVPCPAINLLEVLGVRLPEVASNALQLINVCAALEEDSGLSDHQHFSHDASKGPHIQRELVVLPGHDHLGRPVVSGCHVPCFPAACYIFHSRETKIQDFDIANFTDRYV